MSRDEQKNRMGRIPITYRADRGRWELTIYRDGKRVRSLHSTEEAATKAWRAHCRKIERHGTHGDSISRDEGREFLEAKRIVAGEDLRDVARFWRQHHPEGSSSATISEAWEKFREEKESRGVSKRHLDTLKYHVGRFSRDFGPISVRAISSDDVRKWLVALPHDARTIANFRGSISIFLNWCVRRKFAHESPLTDVHETDMPVVKPRAKGILSVDQCAAMMAHIDAEEPNHAAWHALQLFAGIRRAEAGRMTWDMIDVERETITLPGWIVKTGDDWVLHDLPENLWDWLRKHRGEWEIKEPDSETLKRLRQTGFTALTPPIPSWPQNAMRHTFCTMMISLHSDAAKVANWSRHTNAAQLYKSYVAKLVSREEAERFTKIRPAHHPGTSPTRGRKSGQSEK